MTPVALSQLAEWIWPELTSVRNVENLMDFALLRLNIPELTISTITTIATTAKAQRQVWSDPDELPGCPDFPGPLPGRMS